LIQFSVLTLELCEFSLLNQIIEFIWHFKGISW